MDFKKWGEVLSILVSLTVLGIFIAKVDGWWAKAEDIQTIQQSFEKLEKRLDTKILQDRLSFLRDRVYTLIDEYKTIDGIPELIRNEYRNRMIEIEEIQKKLNK